MAFTTLQKVDENDLNNFSVTTVTTTGAVTVGTTLAVGGTVSPAGLVDASAAGAGQIKFPATQNASSNADTFDDYKERSYTPTWTSGGSAPAIGNGTLTGRYIKKGKEVTLHIYLLAGSTTTFGNNTNSWTFSLPLTADNDVVSYLGLVRVDDAGTGIRSAVCAIAPGGTTIALIHETSGFGGGATSVGFKSDAPMTWANGDSLSLSITYTANA